MGIPRRSRRPVNRGYCTDYVRHEHCAFFVIRRSRRVRKNVGSGGQVSGKRSYKFLGCLVCFNVHGIIERSYIVLLAEVFRVTKLAKRILDRPLSGTQVAATWRTLSALLTASIRRKQTMFERNIHESRVIVGGRRAWRVELLLFNQNLEVLQGLFFASSQMAKMALRVAVLNPRPRWNPVD